MRRIVLFPQAIRCAYSRVYALSSFPAKKRKCRLLFFFMLLLILGTRYTSALTAAKTPFLYFYCRATVPSPPTKHGTSGRTAYDTRTYTPRYPHAYIAVPRLTNLTRSSKTGVRSLEPATKKKGRPTNGKKEGKRYILPLCPGCRKAGKIHTPSPCPAPRQARK